MGNTYPMPRNAGVQAINASSVGSMRTPPSVLMDIANDNSKQWVAPKAANDNYRLAVRTAKIGIRAAVSLGLRLHPIVRAASVLEEVLHALEQTKRDAFLQWDMGALPGGAIAYASYNWNHVDVLPDFKIRLRSLPTSHSYMNLNPATLAYFPGVLSTFAYPPGNWAAIGGQAVGAPALPSLSRGYWAVLGNPNAWAGANRYTYLWGYRLASTSSVPEPIPTQSFPVRQMRVEPYTKPLFTPFPEQFPLIGRPVSAPRAIWGIGTRPGREVGPAPNAPTPPKPRPPDPGTKERKFAIAVGGMWAAGINIVTETLDLGAALYKSLPQWLRNDLRRKNGGYMGPHDKALAVLQYFDQIDGAELIFNLLDMNSEDQTYGKIGRHAARANRNLIGGGGVQLGDAL